MQVKSGFNEKKKNNCYFTKKFFSSPPLYIKFIGRRISF